MAQSPWLLALGNDDASLAGATHGLAAFYRSRGAKGDNEKALSLFKQFLAYTQSVHDENHPTTLMAKHSLASSYNSIDDHPKAETLFLEVLESRRRVLPKGHPDIARVITSLCFMYEQIREYPKAEPLLRECLALREEHEPGEWRTCETQSMLGGCLLGLEKLEEAETLLLRGYQGFMERKDEMPPNRKYRLSKAIQRVVKLYETKMDADQVAVWHAKFEALEEELRFPSARARDE